MNFEIAKGRKPNNTNELNSFLEQQRRYSDIKNNAVPIALNLAGSAFSDVLI